MTNSMDGWDPRRNGIHDRATPAPQSGSAWPPVESGYAVAEPSCNARRTHPTSGLVRTAARCATRFWCMKYWRRASSPKAGLPWPATAWLS